MKTDRMTYTAAWSGFAAQYLIAAGARDAAGFLFSTVGH
jgi:hypothetical protein